MAIKKVALVTTSAVGTKSAPSYTITIGSAVENLLSPLTLPAATLSSTGWSPTLQGTSGNDVFDPGTNQGGTATMIGGGGNDVFYVHGSNDVVEAQAGGINTVITDYGWGAYTLPANVQNLIYDGTASYANGWITLVGNALNDTIVANNLGDALVAGTGSDTLVGGTGPDIFIIGAGTGSDTIINFHGGSATTADSVQLRNLGFTTFAAVQAAMTQSGANTVLNLGGGRTLTFVGQQTTSFTAAEFGLPAGTPLVASAPSLQVAAASGIANTPIALSIAAALAHTDPGEMLVIRIVGVPSGATLSAGTLNADGSWILTSAQLTGLTLTTSANAAATIALTVTAAAAETDGSIATTSKALTVTVGPAAVAPTLTVASASGVAVTPIALSIAAALAHTDPGETLAIRIVGVPTGATLSAGTLNADGSWTLTSAQLTGLTLTTSANAAATIALTVTAAAAETDGSTATTSAGLTVTVGPAAVVPTLTVAPASGVADTPIALSIAAALAHTDSGETLAIRIVGVPSGATLSAGTLNADGSWTLTSAQLTGLTLTPSANTSTTATIALTVSATAAETDGSTASSTQTLAVTVTPAPAYTITIGSAVENLLSPLTLPAATLSSTGWSPTLQGTSGNDVFDPGTNPGGTATMIGGGGNDVFYVHGSNDVVEAQAGGINTVITDYGWGTYTLPANVQNLIYDGTASYADGWITLTGNALNDTIVANNLGDALVAGTGSDTLVGGTGPDIFIIGAGTGSDTIINFHGGSATTADSVQLQNLGFTTFAAVQAAMTQSGANTVLNLGGGRTLTFIGQQTTSFTAAEFGLPASATSGSSGGSANTTPVTTAAATETDPVIVQPTQSGQVVGFLLRNNGTTALAAHEITFSETFADGAVPAGSQLVATIGGQQVAVQMDVKTTHADGSVAMAVLTLMQPALGADASASGMLSLASTQTAPAAIALSGLTAANYSVTVNLDLHNADGTSTDYALDVGSLLKTALANGTATYILQGAQVTEARFDVPIAGSLHLTFDVSLFADGSTATNVSFNNDIALAATGGTVDYDATITQNGSVVLQQSNISQIQYTSWNQEVYSNGAPQAQVVYDVAELEATGAIPNYDLTAGVDTATIAAEASQLGGSTYGILGSASVLQYMPTTGGRADIGPQPEWNVAWLMTQDPVAETYALDQAAAAGSVPWSFIDAETDIDLTVTQYPNLWVDGRASTSAGYTALTQAVSSATGWTADPAHQPDLSYVAYLLTGQQQYLYELNAQASWAESDDWTGYRQNGLGLVANGQDQVRQQAWSLREIDEAAYANPDGSAMKTYFTQMEDNNWQWLVSQIPTWTAEEGQAYGYLPGNYGSGTIAPWEQDYFVSTAVEAAEQGNQDAVTFLKWESNFIVGRFLNADNGFAPQNGVAYNLTVSDASGAPLQTWAAIETASAAAGQTNDANWSQSQGDYAQLAEQSLAGIITVTESTAAIQAYGWLLASGAPELNAIAGTQFDIVPRLTDGQLLTANHVIISTDTSATTLTGTNDDQLIEAGSGNDTIYGGSGINILFAGSGNDVLIGGANADYLFAGSGADTLSAGAGNNFMQAGSGADIFDLSATDIATDIIADFKLGVDHLVIAGNGPSSAFVGNLLQTMTQDGSGNAVLHLSASHTVTLQGIGETSVTTSIFG
jgi:Ca2+-binding RTX toxin-like protein